MCANIKRCFSGIELSNCEIFHSNFQLDSEKYILISGKIYSPYGKPLVNAAIMINSIDERFVNSKKRCLGVIFSDNLGEYGVSLLKNPHISYEFKAYCSV